MNALGIGRLELSFVAVAVLACLPAFVAGPAQMARRSVVERAFGRIEAGVEAFHRRRGAWPSLDALAPTDAPCPDACGARAEACTTLACVGFARAPADPHTYACSLGAQGDQADVTCAAAADLDGDGQARVFVRGTNHRGAATLAVAPPAVAPLGACAGADLSPGYTWSCQGLDTR